MPGSVCDVGNLRGPGKSARRGRMEWGYGDWEEKIAWKKKGGGHPTTTQTSVIIHPSAINPPFFPLGRNVAHKKNRGPKLQGFLGKFCFWGPIAF